MIPSKNRIMTEIHRIRYNLTDNSWFDEGAIPE